MATLELEVQVPDDYTGSEPLVADSTSLIEMIGANLAVTAGELKGVAEGGT